MVSQQLQDIAKITGFSRSTAGCQETTGFNWAKGCTGSTAWGHYNSRLSLQQQGSLQEQGVKTIAGYSCNNKVSKQQQVTQVQKQVWRVFANFSLDCAKLIQKLAKCQRQTKGTKVYKHQSHPAPDISFYLTSLNAGSASIVSSHVQPLYPLAHRHEVYRNPF